MKENFNVKGKNGAIAIFVLVGLLFMTSFLIISYGYNVNKSKVAKEQFNIISDIYSHKDGDANAYERAYTALRKQNKQTLTASAEDTSTLELEKTYAENLVNYRIYGRGVYSENHDLPVEYKEVEYIESTGTQYIDTKYKPNNLTKVELEFMYNALEGFVYGSRTAYRSDDANALIIDGYKKTYPQFGSQQLEIESPYTETGVKYSFINSQEGAYINNDLIKSYETAIFSSNYSMFLCGLNQSGVLESRTFKGRIYSFKVWDNGSLVRNMVPCYRKNDNVVGLYDIVEGFFYTNQGTGEFFKGNSVLAVGDLVTDEENQNYGKYKISIKCTNIDGESVIKDIYLDKPLEEGEYIDFKTRRIVRNDGIGESIELPEIEIYEDYTKIEVLTKETPLKIEVEYTGYIISNEMEGYTTLEYIESTGTQYIDTGYKPNNLTKVELEFMYNTLEGFVYGSRTSSGSNDAHSFIINGGEYSYPQFNGQQDYVTSSYNKTGIRYVLNNSQNGANINGNLIKRYETAAFSSNYSMFLFGLNQSSILESRTFKGRIYYCKIWDNNVLTRNFIPCKRDLDGVIGLYDTVTKEFYTNDGTGTFIAGPEV